MPQGSVISPTLFTLYINDLFQNLPTQFSCSLYADDSAIWLSGTDISLLRNKMQDCLNSVEIWSHKWGLEFSSSKTKAIIFTHRHCTNVAPLTFQGKEIEYVQKIKFLGMYFDRKLTWSYHIKYVADKCQRDLQLLRVVAGSNWGGKFFHSQNAVPGLAEVKA